MKAKTWYACSRCAYRAGHQLKCINCNIPLEKICMVCNNAETSCYFVNCSRVSKAVNKKGKAIKRKKGKKK